MDDKPTQRFMITFISAASLSVLSLRELRHDAACCDTKSCSIGNMDSILEIFLNIISSTWFIIFTFFNLFYIYMTWNFKHFEKLGIPQLKPTPFFGNLKDRLLFKLSLTEMHHSIYKQLKGHPYGGYFSGRTPKIMLRDPEVIRQLFVRDFDCFVDRPLPSINPKSYEESHLILMKGSQWKDIRTISSPIFSSGKIKMMSGLITKCTEQMIKYLDTFHINKTKELEMKEFFTRYTMDVIASCAFGVQCNSLEDPDCEFLKIALNINKHNIFKRIGLAISVFGLGNVRLARLCGMSLMNKSSVNFLAQVLIDSKKKRELDERYRRPDFLQLMLDAQAGRLKTEAVKDEDLYDKDARLKADKTDVKKALTDEVVIGQSLLFLVAGFDTSSTLLTFTSYELALNPELQERARAEVRSVLETHGGRCTYEAISQMPYLENVLMETLRKHPPGSAISRVCTAESYTMPGGGNRKLQKGAEVTISIRGIHNDERFYPDPEKFDPDRFLPENKQKRSPYAFIPFGTGPRNCIGMRFAMMTTKMAMASLLNVYKFEVCGRTEIPYTICKKVLLLRAANGIYLNVSKVE